MKRCAKYSAQSDTNSPSLMLHRSLLRSTFLASFVSEIAITLCLLSSCVSLDTPPAGQPVAIHPAQALVFGHIRMIDAEVKNYEYAPFSFDPYIVPFFAPAPRMTIELRQHFPPGGVFKYKAYPAPPTETDGSFFWLLSAGDYELLGNQRLLGSKQYNEGETGALARFSVPKTSETIYICTLTISIVYGLEDYARAWRTDEAGYEIRSLRVTDERDRYLSKLRERYPVLPEPVTTDCMRTE